MKEFFPNKVTVSRSANNNELLQGNFSDMKFKVFYLTSSKNFFFSDYFLMVATQHYY